MKQNSRIQLENTLIGALGVLSLVLFILSFLPGLGLANRVGILLEMGHMVQRAFSVVLFILTFQLWKRKRAAWNIAVLLLFLSFLRGLTALSSPLYLPFHLAEAVLFLLLLCFRKDFCCPSDRRSLGAFQDNHKVFTSLSRHSVSFVVVVVERFFQNSVDEFCFLFFS